MDADAVVLDEPVDEVFSNAVAFAADEGVRVPKWLKQKRRRPSM